MNCCNEFNALYKKLGNKLRGYNPDFKKGTDRKDS